MESLFFFVTQALMDPEYYLELLVVLCAIACSILISAQLKRYLILKSGSMIIFKNVSVGNVIEKLFKPLFTPSLSVIFLALGQAALMSFNRPTYFILATIQFTLVWMILRLVRIFSDNQFLSFCVGVILIPVVCLNVLGLYQPTIEYLDHYAFSIGTFRVSIYTILKALVVTCLLLWLASICSSETKSYIRKARNIKASTRELLTKFFDIILYFVVFLIILNILGIDLTALAVIGSALGVGFALGTQKISSNFVSGVILLFERSLEIDDLIELDGGALGWIRHLGARYTLIETYDGKEIMVPNEEFITSRVTNLTYTNTQGRIDIKVRVSYGSDLEKALEVLQEAARTHPRCSNHPVPECYIASFEEDFVHFILYFWIDDVTKGRNGPRSDVMLTIWNMFREHNIEMPLPQRVLQLKEDDKKTSFTVMQKNDDSHA